MWGGVDVGEGCGVLDVCQCVLCIIYVTTFLVSALQGGKPQWK